MRNIPFIENPDVPHETMFTLQQVVHEGKSAIPFTEYLKNWRRTEHSSRELSVTELAIDIDKDAELPKCPRCGTQMVRNGYAVRTLQVDEHTFRMRVPVCLCRSCRAVCRDKTNDERPQYTHRVLAVGIFPYKRTPADTIIACGQLAEEQTRNPRNDELYAAAEENWKKVCTSCESSTLERWGKWFRRLKRHVIGTLRSLSENLGIRELMQMAETLKKPLADFGQIELAVQTVLFQTGRLSI